MLYRQQPQICTHRMALFGLGHKTRFGFGLIRPAAIPCDKKKRNPYNDVDVGEEKYFPSLESFVLMLPSVQ